MGTWGGAICRKSFSVDYSAAEDNVLYRPGPLPPVHEEIFEWHSLASAIADARDRFVFIELGAGHGRWSVAAALACRRRGLNCDLIAVEAEPTHYAMMKQHFGDNGIDWREHTLIEAAVAPRDGEVYFAVGAADRWWGQLILAAPDADFGVIENTSVVSVPAVSLPSILETADRVDLIDMDVQHAEADIVDAAIGELARKVRRLHIGTHEPAIEVRLRATLTAAGWRAVWDFPCHGPAMTPYGRITFQDGVQAWRNPRL
jgi:FkbM family methyltransferase